MVNTYQMSLRQAQADKGTGWYLINLKIDHL